MVYIYTEHIYIYTNIYYVKEVFGVSQLRTRSSVKLGLVCKNTSGPGSRATYKQVVLLPRFHIYTWVT